MHKLVSTYQVMHWFFIVHLVGTTFIYHRYLLILILFIILSTILSTSERFSRKTK